MMRICKIYIHDFQQFKDFTLDLTDPNGEPLEKVCLIGRNGTGKTLLLEFLKHFCFESIFSLPARYLDGFRKCYIEIKIQEKYYYLTKNRDRVLMLYPHSDVKRASHSDILDYVERNWDFITLTYSGKIEDPKADAKYDEIEDLFLNNCSLAASISADLIQTDDIRNNLETTLDDSFRNSNLRPVLHNISEQTDKSANFWSIFTKHLIQRRDKWDAIIENSDNDDLQLGFLRKEFNTTNFNFADYLDKLWDKILDKAGLELDKPNIKVPRIPNLCLEANIRLKKTKEPISYYQLSTGIRNFLFKIGHLRALYFERKIENGFVFYDEPETSLHADFLYDFVSEYLNFMTNTQLFMATHSEIIASQFEPYERVILEYDPDDLTRVRARKGIAPIGDDPNDLLKKDFDTDIYNRHPKAKEAWAKFLNLRNLIAHGDSSDELLEEYTNLAKKYDFPTFLKRNKLL